MLIEFHMNAPRSATSVYSLLTALTNRISYENNCTNLARKHTPMHIHTYTVPLPLLIRLYQLRGFILCKLYFEIQSTFAVHMK